MADLAVCLPFGRSIAPRRWARLAVVALGGGGVWPVLAGSAPVPTGVVAALPDPAPLLIAQQTNPAPEVNAPAPAAPAAGEDAAASQPNAPRRMAQPWSFDSLPQPFPPAAGADERVQILVGVAANTSPNFFGGPSQQFSLKPVIGLQWGRWRLSTGGGYGLMGQGRRDLGSGAQAVLTDTDRFNLSLSLNIDRGRDVAETDRLKGVPDVRSTLRARLRARYYLTDRWTASLAASQDLLGRGRGMELDGWLGYRWPLSEATRIDLGIGASWGNDAYMRSQFGIPASATAASGYPAFAPRAGLYQTELGVDVAHALSRTWVLFGGLRYSQLHGDARRTPLTERSSGVSATIGIAWRN